MSDPQADWVETAAEAVLRAVAGRDDLLALVVSAVGRHEPFVIPVPRRKVEAAASNGELRSAIERHQHPRVPLLPLLDEAGARAWDAYRESFAGEDTYVADMLQFRLASMCFPDEAVPLVTVTGIAWRLAERHVAPDRLAALGPAASVTRAPRSREELAELLEAYGVPPSVAELAKWGLALVSGGQGESRLGGRPQLDDEWPIGNGGRAHTHLASIVLAELPDFHGRDLLPRDGTLVFLADFDEEGEADARVIYVAPGAGHPVAPPVQARDERDVPIELNERRVRFEPVLTLAIPRGLDDAEEAALWGLYGNQLHPPDHLLLGHPDYIQDNAPDDGQVSLLQLNWDEGLNYMYGDGGQITFHGTPADIRSGRWDRISTQLDSS